MTTAKGETDGHAPAGAKGVAPDGEGSSAAAPRGGERGGQRGDPGHSAGGDAVPSGARHILEFGPDAIRLRSLTGEELASAPIGETGQPEGIEGLRALAADGSDAAPAVVLWLPDEQVAVFSPRLPRDERDRILGAFTAAMAKTGQPTAELALAMAPQDQPDGRATVFAAYAQTVREAQAYAEGWGFRHVAVSNGRLAAQTGTPSLGLRPLDALLPDRAAPKGTPEARRGPGALSARQRHGAVLAVLVVSAAVAGGYAMIADDDPALPLPPASAAPVALAAPDTRLSDWATTRRAVPLTPQPQIAMPPALRSTAAAAGPPPTIPVPDTPPPADGEPVRPPQDRQALARPATVPEVSGPAMAGLSPPPRTDRITALEVQSAAPAPVPASGAEFLPTDPAPAGVAPLTMSLLPRPRPQPAAATPEPGVEAATDTTADAPAREPVAAEAVPPPTARPADLATAAEPSVPAPPPRSAVTALQATRLRQALESAAMGAASSPVDDARLIGVLYLDGRRQALLQLGNGTYHRVGIGDTVGEWVIDEIEDEAVRLSYEGETRVYPLISR